MHPEKSTKQNKIKHSQFFIYFGHGRTNFQIRQGSLKNHGLPLVSGRGIWGNLKLDNAPNIFTPLTLEIFTPHEISLCHYSELNSDLMRDPEMVFFKDMSGDYWPTYYRNDWLGIEKTCAYPDGVGYEAFCYTDEDRQEQADQCKFARVWLKNIVAQQNLKIPASITKYVPIEEV
jgi:hypothetical protein